MFDSSNHSADILTLEAKLKSNEKIIARQNAEVNINTCIFCFHNLLSFSFFEKNQIEYLRENNSTLEQRLQELSDLKRDLSNKQYEERLKNDDLLRDLKDIDRLARKVQADKQHTVEAADRELTEAKVIKINKFIYFFYSIVEI